MAYLTTKDLKQYLKKLRKDLTILQERKAKYAGFAPLALLNQLDDYTKAIELTKDTLIGDLELEELEQALKPLILELDGGDSKEAPLKIPPPPDPKTPPEIRNFIGRKEELSYFMAKLEDTNIALITGMIGCGKTSLAATLAQTWQLKQLMGITKTPDVPLSETELTQIKQKTFWYTFYQDEGILDLIHDLAGFLYYDGHPDLWEMLESARLKNISSSSIENLYNYVFQMIRNKGYLLCLDDTQFVHNDNLLYLFVDRLRDLFAKNEVHVILTAREKPAYITQPYKPITGLNKTDTTALLNVRGLNLNEELNTEVYNLTEGNAKLLDLTILVLLKAKNKHQTLQNLAQSDDIERYLLEQVDSTLSQTQRNTLIATAVLLGYPATRSAIEEVSGQRRLKQTILSLSDRYLLTVYDDYDNEEEEELYQSHATIRNFYYDFPNARELKKLHTVAAEFYHEEEDFIKAARHYERATQYQTVVDLLTTHFWSLMNQGQSQILQRMLNRLIKQPLLPIQTIKITLALADMYQKIGELETAKSHYQQCLNLLSSLAPSNNKQLFKANACKGMAESILFNDVTKALQWVEQGLTALKSMDPEEKINLLLLKSTLQIRKGHYQTARQIIEEVLQQIPAQSSGLRIIALRQLGDIAWYLGENEKATQFATQALILAEQYHDYFEVVKLLNNLGIYKNQKGDMVEADSTYQKALTLAQDIGLIQEQLKLYENLGILHVRLGNYQQAEDYFLKQLAMAEEKDMQFYIITAKVNMSNLYIKQTHFNKASNYLKEILSPPLKEDLSNWLPPIYSYLALIALAENEISTALQHANKAVQVAREFNLPNGEGVGLCVLGQVQLANNNPTAALESFAESVALLTNKNLYNLSYTQLVWGRYLITTPKIEQGHQLLQTARNSFKKMGAKVDLAETEALLKIVNSEQ